MTYQQLKQLVASYLHRSDMTDVIPGFIDMATKRLGRDLRVSENTVFDTRPISSSPYQFPDYFRELQTIRYMQDRGPRTLQSVASHRFTLYPVQGSPSVYMIQNGQLQIAPFTAGYYALTYWREPQGLVNEADTNPILEAYPYLYLYAALVEAHIYLQDAELAQAFAAIYGQEKDVANTAARKQKAGDAPAMIGV